MPDIYGNDEMRYIEIPVYPHPPRPTPFPGLSILTACYAVVAFLYVVGCISAFPRTPGHDVIAATGYGLVCVAYLCWQAVKSIPYIGPILYVLPALCLPAAPFALDVYLMARR